MISNIFSYEGFLFRIFHSSLNYILLLLDLFIWHTFTCICIYTHTCVYALVFKSCKIIWYMQVYSVHIFVFTFFSICILCMGMFICMDIYVHTYVHAYTHVRISCLCLRILAARETKSVRRCRTKSKATNPSQHVRVCIYMPNVLNILKSIHW